MASRLVWLSVYGLPDVVSSRHIKNKKPCRVNVPAGVFVDPDGTSCLMVVGRRRPFADPAHVRGVGHDPASATATTTSTGIEQIDDLFVVQLQKLGRHLELWRGQTARSGLGLEGRNAVKQLPHCPRDDAQVVLLAFAAATRVLESCAHGIGLARPRLAVGQDGCIVPAKRILEIASEKSAF